MRSSTVSAKPQAKGQALPWTKPEAHEALATLYLRLNGYFTTGLVLHSAFRGQNRSEVDCLAVRFPAHSQPERDVPTAPFLAVQDGVVDLIICEVKSSPAGLKFNESLQENPPHALRSLLRWSGVFADNQINSIADRMRPLLGDGPAEDVRRGVSEGGCRVRPLLCCPPCGVNGCRDRWCLAGDELFRFVDECFNPAVKRPACATRYNFELWGNALSPLVKYFKALHREEAPGSLAGLYSYLGAA